MTKARIGSAFANITAGDDQIRLTLTQNVEHGGQKGFIMLQVGVNDGDIGGGAGQCTFDNRARQSPTPDTPKATDPRILKRKGLDGFSRAIGTIIIDIDDLPANGGQSAV